MAKKKTRAYRSSARDRQAMDTRARIADAAHKLLVDKGYEGMTIEGIARAAEVVPQTVYAVFRSKAGILAELLDRTAFGPNYQELTQHARENQQPLERLRFAARIARHIFDSQLETIDLLQGASLVTPELADLIREREGMRFEKQKHMIDFLIATGSLNPLVEPDQARDILWALTSRELYNMLVRQRKWPSQQYEDWLGDVLVSSLLGHPQPTKRSPARKKK
jgi:AcrR family transcriptional regulator